VLLASLRSTNAWLFARLARGRATTSDPCQTPLMGSDPKIAEVLSLAEAIKNHLVSCVISLSAASKWAGRDRFSFNPINAVIAMPLKYWHLRKSRQHLANAQRMTASLSAEIQSELGQGEIEVSKLAMALDLWGEVSQFSQHLPGSGYGAFGEIWADVHIESQVETSLVSVNGMLDDVGLLCAKLRSVAEQGL